MTETDDRRRWAALLVLCLAMLMVILDQTVVNVALPSIQEDLGFSQADLAWVVNAYLIAFGGLLLLAGRVGDLIGRKHVFMGGLTVFTAASLLCGVAASQELLIGARFLQGIGGAVASAVVLGMIVTMFPEPGERAKAIGVYSFVGAAGGSIGLLLGGALTEAISWHWIFFVNVPIGAAAALLAARLVARDEGIGLREGADVPGALLLVAALMLAVYTVVEAAEAGWGSAQTLLLGALAIALLGAFVHREAHAAHPLIPLRVFRSGAVASANVAQALMVAASMGMFFLGALYLQRVLGYDPAQVGLAFLPVAVSIGVFSLAVSPRLITRHGPVRTMLAAFGFLATGLALLARLPVGADYATDLLPALVLLGVGGGLAFPSLATLAMSGVPEREAGLASGLINTSVQVGGALGLAVLATISTTRSASLRAAGDGVAEALAGGYRLALLVGAGLLLVAAAVAAAQLRSRPAAAPEAPAEPLPAAQLEEAA